jgi:hypothetical protein
MKKFNFKSLENTFDKINDIQKTITNNENSIVKSTYKKYNNKSIETILYVILMCFEQDYLNASKEYYDRINYFSDNYLMGSEWYIGPEYTREYHYSQLDLDTKYKLCGFLLFLINSYKK